MNRELSSNTQAILLLTAPLIAGREDSFSELLTPGEFNRLARFLRENRRELSDLLGHECGGLISECRHLLDSARVERLLGRGFLLSQAVEKWRARAVWVLNRDEDAYPERIKTHLKDDAPPILYGCGDPAVLNMGGLAIVGSRHVDESLIEYTANVAGLAARAGRTVVSGGARGIDQAAMRGALQEDGRVAGVLADSLERAVLVREHRDVLGEGKLTLISPYDPAAGFNVGHAMQRNKLIYALADAALVVSSDFDKGGTWAGAIEQIERYRFVPVFVRTRGETGKGLDALRKKGALPWPEPADSDALVEALSAQRPQEYTLPKQDELTFVFHEEPLPESRKQDASAKRRPSRQPRG